MNQIIENSEKFKKKIDLEYVKFHGKVEKVSDGMVFCSGIEKAMIHEIILVDEKYEAVVIELGEDIVGAGLLYNTDKVKEGMEVICTNKLISAPSDPNLVGTIIDPMGKSITGDNVCYPINHDFPAFKSAPQIMSIGSVTRPLETGILAIDSSIPIGRGQRQLVLGNRQTGKTQIAIDTIASQKESGVICIYVAIGQRMGQITKLKNTLDDLGASAYTTIVSANASSSLTSQYIAPYIGMAIAEEISSTGKDVLVIFDDLSKHADAYRALSLLLKRPPGREAYPGDIFYVHSSLLERAVQFKQSNGGGSITAIPIVETLSDDVTAYIPTNIISITDGQIFLKSDIFNAGHKPAIDITISVSRVGGSAQNKIVKKLSSSIMLILSQYNELVELLSFENSFDKETYATIEKGTIINELFQQPVLATLNTCEKVIILYGIENNLFKNIGQEKISAFKTFLITKFNENDDVKTLLKLDLSSEEMSQVTQNSIINLYKNVRSEFGCLKD